MEPNIKPIRSWPKELTRNWGYLFALGVLFICLGIMGLSMVVGLTLVSILFLGVLFLVAGFAQLIDVFKSSEWKAVLWHALIAILYLLGGVLVIKDPVLASALITAMLAWILILIGITRFVMAYVLRHTSEWGFLLLAGITSSILGILILIQWPFSGLWVIGLFIAIELMMNGWSYLFIALGLRRSAQK